ncbi:unnamed protein product [Rotaria sp. Silwood1]|nr:unnamed protein product [Rotaria sp. Silwood1]
MGSSSSSPNACDQSDRTLEVKSKHRILFDYPLSTPSHPPKPVWSSKRLAKVQERRPITDPIFIYLNPMDMSQCACQDSCMDCNSQKKVTYRQAV